MDVNYFSKYNKNTFCYEENLDSSVKEKGAGNSFKSNLYEWIFRMLHMWYNMMKHYCWTYNFRSQLCIHYWTGCFELFEFVCNFVCKYRSSLPEVFLRKGVLKICRKFAGGQPCGSVISIKLQSNSCKFAAYV